MELSTLLEEHYGIYFEEALRREIIEYGMLKKVSTGDLMIDIGDYVRSMPLLISGAIKIMREDDNGDELVLYFLEKGDACAMTMTCCMGSTRSKIRAVAASDTLLIMIPVQKMEEWIIKFRTWRSFVFESYDTRFEEMLSVINALAFQQMDERLYNYLKDKAMVLGDAIITNTHQEISKDLNTSRVVISRLLKQLENSGYVQLHRNHIEILTFSKYKPK